MRNLGRNPSKVKPECLHAVLPGNGSLITPLIPDWQDDSALLTNRATMKEIKPENFHLFLFAAWIHSPDLASILNPLIGGINARSDINSGFGAPRMEHIILRGTKVQFTLMILCQGANNYYLHDAEILHKELVLSTRPDS